MDEPSIAPSDSPPPLNNAASEPNEVLRRYELRRDQLQSEIDAQKRRWTSIGYVRGLLFLLALANLIGGFMAWADASTVWFALSLVLFLGFLVVACFHENLEARLFRERIQFRFIRNSIARINRDWQRLPAFDVADEIKDLPIVNDLDLVGRASLFSLICHAETPIGRQQLLNWMIHPAEPDAITLRQRAIQELAACTGHTDRIQLLGNLITHQHSDPSKFLAWATRERDTVGGPFLKSFARISALAVILILLLLLVGAMSLPQAAIGLAICFTMNFGLSVVVANPIHALFNEVASRQADARHYMELLDCVTEFRPDSECLKRLQQRLMAGEATAQQAFSKLGLRTWLANLRRNGLFYPIYLLLQFFLLWDIHVLQGLTRWRKAFGRSVPDWFEALAHWEALCSLARVRQDHPDWTIPTVKHQSKESARLVASQLGHPLLPPSDVVRNDAEVGPTGTILLVTGSNMSGKSTLLRSIGLNAVLAQMGSVVCAETLSMPPVRLQTSIRISDSIADGVSFYFAELKRLKEVVSAAVELAADDRVIAMYLLDEILQGTNSRERQIAVCKVLEHLVRSLAIGAISTHDLELVSAEGLQTAFRPVHFRETIVNRDGQRSMTFDYKIRDGVATTTNALELLRLVGLDDSDPA